MTVNFKNEDNYYHNAVLNCIEVLKAFSRDERVEIRHFYEEDVINPDTPSVCIIVNQSEDQMRISNAMQQIRYTINIDMEVWYYYADLTEEIKRNKVMYELWKMNDYLKKHITLNGFAPKLGLEVSGTRWVPVRRGSRILASGVIPIRVKKLYKTTSTS